MAVAYVVRQLQLQLDPQPGNLPYAASVALKSKKQKTYPRIILFQNVNVSNFTSSQKVEGTVTMLIFQKKKLRLGGHLLVQGHSLGYESQSLGPGLTSLLACVSPHLPGFSLHFWNLLSYLFVCSLCVLKALNILPRGLWRKKTRFVQQGCFR